MSHLDTAKQQRRKQRLEQKKLREFWLDVLARIEKGEAIGPVERVRIDELVSQWSTGPSAAFCPLGEVEAWCPIISFVSERFADSIGEHENALRGSNNFKRFFSNMDEYGDDDNYQIKYAFKLRDDWIRRVKCE